MNARSAGAEQISPRTRARRPWHLNLFPVYEYVRLQLVNIRAIRVIRGLFPFYFLTTDYLEQPLAATRILNREWTRIFTNKNVYISVRWECTLPARRATDILAQGNALG
jgi:hypothetical protein